MPVRPQKRWRLRDAGTLLGAGLPTLLILLVVALPGPVGASTAGLYARQIPRDLVADISGLDRFPASARAMRPGLYGDLEAVTERRQVALWGPGKSRLGLLFHPENDRELTARTRAFGAVWAFPWGNVDLGISALGWSDRSDRDEWRRTSYERWSKTDAQSWFYEGTFSAAVPLGRRGSLEAALFAGKSGHQVDQRMRYLQQEEALLEMDQESDAELSWGGRARWTAGWGAGRTLLGLLAYERYDATTVQTYHETTSVDTIALTGEQPDRVHRLRAACALRARGPRRIEITSGLAVTYTEGEQRALDVENGSWATQEDRQYLTEARAFIGASWRAHRHLELLGGVALRYTHDRDLHARREPDGEDQISRRTEAEFSDGEFRWGARLRLGSFYLTGTAHESFSTSNPFVALSIGYRS